MWTAGVGVDSWLGDKRGHTFWDEIFFDNSQPHDIKIRTQKNKTCKAYFLRKNYGTFQIKLKRYSPYHICYNIRYYSVRTSTTHTSTQYLLLTLENVQLYTKFSAQVLI